MTYRRGAQVELSYRCADPEHTALYCPAGCWHFLAEVSCSISISELGPIPVWVSTNFIYDGIITEGGVKWNEATQK